MRRSANHTLPLAAAAVLCTASFALGVRVASSHAGEAVDLDRSLARIRDGLSSRDRLTQAVTLAPSLLAMGQDDVEAVAGVFEASFASGGSGGLPTALLVERLAGLDPLAARERIQTWPDERRTEALPILVRAWARSDPGTAIGVLNEILEPQIRQTAFTALIEGWSESGHAGVWRYLAGLPPGMDRERGIIIVVQQRMARDGAVAAIQEIEQLPDEPPMDAFKERALRTAVGVLARSDPARAAAIVEAHRDDPKVGRLMRRVAVNWVTQDGPAAMAWILTQPQTLQRDRVMREAYRRWVVRDRAAAVAWMADRDDPAGLESIFDMHATALARSDPQTAIAWVRRIEDPALRVAALADVAVVWHHEDPDSARAWLEQAGLYDDFLRRKERRVEMRRERRAAQLEEANSGAPDGG